MVLAGASMVPPANAAPGSDSYGYDPDAQTVRGSSSLLSAPELATGTPYRSTLSGSEPVYFRVALDAKSHTYVSVVGIPGPGTERTPTNSLQVTLVDADGNRCDRQGAGFAIGSAQPLAASASRMIAPTKGAAEAKCQRAGPYFVAVSRYRQRAGAAPWGLDLRVDAEPPLKKSRGDGPAARSPRPSAPDGSPTPVEGGAGFAVAARVREGAVTGEITPGQSRFYRVPVDWGQRLTADAELAGQKKGPYVANGLSVTVYNPARMKVEGTSTSYHGQPATAGLDALPPVAYENRSDRERKTAAMRFPGWYFVQVTASPELAPTWGRKPLRLTVHLDIEGSARKRPVYAGDPGVFEVPGGQPPAPTTGRPAATETADGGGRMMLATGSFTAGALLLAVSAGRVLRARRRTA
ncbi:MULTISPECIES: hypothetical protein [unclassified Streptomyces]|uniref:hypothetical protein n=1 Tax=unclassified Streptomyces TaxID=2593676 RepID=UPI003326D4D9